MSSYGQATVLRSTIHSEGINEGEDTYVINNHKFVGSDFYSSEWHATRYKSYISTKKLKVFQK